ncbi:hypothetical protein O7626_31350 [Micromonospora sp. WMMD1102]|uniref:hypothetical protein n=1 Tax=Micromonospora sp. WMMD1102 TaxID=3016105 RepID=UPI0024158659|nr:hypothetical protein [Micromonospora sp. WMMD1102]MDG4790365.1 hypothetical protein [Micromonospora sp. WMMD1102]
MVDANGWYERTDDAVSRFRQLDDGAQGVMAYSLMAGACGPMYGWDHDWTAGYLDKVLALQNPDGGWGLNRPADSFGDGSVNPASTSYAVTVAGHVGPTLLAGWQAGVVPRALVQQCVNFLVGMPRVSVTHGQCVAYSTTLADRTGSNKNVHNVNAGAGSFLAQAAEAGISQSGMHRLIADITCHEVDCYRPATKWWPYAGSTGGGQDVDHNSYSAESMYRLAYWIGREAVYNHMANPQSDNAMAPLARLRLVSLPASGPAAMSVTGTGQTLWADLVEQWMPELDAWIANPPAPLGGRLAQIAYYGARAMTAAL